MSALNFATENNGLLLIGALFDNAVTEGLKSSDTGLSEQSKFHVKIKFNSLAGGVCGCRITNPKVSQVPLPIDESYTNNIVQGHLLVNTDQNTTVVYNDEAITFNTGDAILCLPHVFHSIKWVGEPVIAYTTLYQNSVS